MVAPIKPPLSNEPADTALKQQRMKAWNPILDPVYVIFTLLTIGIIFIPVGTQMLRINNRVVEIVKTYDSIKSEKISAGLGCEINDFNESKSCTIVFEVEKDMEAPIMLYYEVENFYQNHREYTTSRDDAQVRLIYQYIIAKLFGVLRFLLQGIHNLIFVCSLLRLVYFTIMHSLSVTRCLDTNSISCKGM